MLEYDTIHTSKETDVNKISASKECDICHYWYFKDIGFKYEPYLCNGCHDLMQKSFNDIAIVYIKGSAYKSHFWYTGKDDAISIMSNSNWVDKKKIILIFFIIHKKSMNTIQLKKLIVKETET